MDYLHLTLRTTRLLRLLSTLHGMLLSFFILSSISSDDIPFQSSPLLRCGCCCVSIADENDASAWPAHHLNPSSPSNKAGMLRAPILHPVYRYSTLSRYGADALSCFIVMLAYQYR